MPKKSTKKVVTTKTGTTTSSVKPHKLKTPTYSSFRLQKRHTKPKAAKIQSSFTLFRQALGILGRNWKVFSGIVAVYALLNLLLVQGYFGLDIETVKANSQVLISGSWGSIAGGFSGLSYLFSNAGASPTTGAYRVILMVIASLVVIWTLRQAVTDAASKKLRVRDAFYSGMYPLIPFMLVFLLICLQLVPLTLAMYLVSVAGITSIIELILWAAVLISLGVLTFYMTSSSIFALYIACLPDMQPVAALRAAVQLVRYRRWFVLRRLLFLPFILFVGLVVIIVPLIVVFSPAAVAVFFVFLMTVLPVVHSYMYLLYRELLNAQ